MFDQTDSRNGTKKAPRAKHAAPGGAFAALAAERAPQEQSAPEPRWRLTNPQIFHGRDAMAQAENWLNALDAQGVEPVDVFISGSSARLELGSGSSSGVLILRRRDP